MSRIGSYGASQMYLSRLSAIQQRINNEQIQVTTEKKSQNYTGISSDSNRLINLENEKARAEKFVKDNAMTTTRLKAASVSMGSIETAMKNFKKQLDNYTSTGSKDQQNIQQLQDFAFNAMIDLQSYLAANVDGQYIFSGGRVSDEPVDLPASTREKFQQVYDGSDHPFPTSRAAHMADLSTTTAATGNLSFNAAAGTITAATAGSLAEIPVGSRITVGGASAGNNQTYTVVGNTGTQLDVSRLTTETTAAATITYGTPPTTVSATGALTFAPGTDTITAANAGSLAGLPVGTVFTISGSPLGNDGTYQVAATNGSNQVTIQSTKIGTTETVGATLSADSWYQGDTLQVQQRIDIDRTVDLGVYASDPAFEKAFRAMGMIAQGVFGTAGGLENNMERIDQARSLMQDAIARNGDGVGPFGAELSGDIESLQARVGITEGLVKTKNEKHTAFSGFLDTRIIEMENIDKTEAVTRLLDDQQALQTSYQALASVRNLSLLNYMK